MKSIDLFAGAGGITDGLRQAGIETVFANEFDSNAAKTFSHNHPEVILSTKSIIDLSSDEVISATGLKVGELDLLTGGPPCQGFSISGLRVIDDPRNFLYKEYVRLVCGLKPTTFIFENVVGITSLNDGLILEQILQDFDDLNYTCSYKIVNCVEYGLPQRRQRFFIIGNRNGVNIGFPEITHSQSNGMIAMQGLKPFVTTLEAIGDLPIIKSGEGDAVQYHSGNYNSEYSKARRGNRNPGVIYNHITQKHSDLLIKRNELMPPGVPNGAGNLPPPYNIHRNDFYKLDRNKPSKTVIGKNHQNIHFDIPRTITVREAARLQSFDDDYLFIGPRGGHKHPIGQQQQVGNAIPPLIGKVLGQYIIERLK